MWIAASTHDGEDEIVLDAHRRLLEKSPDALLILVPRHPQRFDSVAELASDGLVMRRMTDTSGSQAQVILGDTMGQMIYLYGVAQIAFIGGSLVAHGGHNPIEAAATGLPLIMGPHDFNFALGRRGVRSGRLPASRSRCDEPRRIAERVCSMTRNAAPLK